MHAASNDRQRVAESLAQLDHRESRLLERRMADQPASRFQISHARINNQARTPRIQSRSHHERDLISIQVRTNCQPQRHRSLLRRSIGLSGEAGDEALDVRPPLLDSPACVQGFIARRDHEAIDTAAQPFDHRAALVLRSIRRCSARHDQAGEAAHIARQVGGEPLVPDGKSVRGRCRGELERSQVVPSFDARRRDDRLNGNRSHFDEGRAEPS